MKLNEKVSWLMGRLQRSLFPNLEQCCVSPLSELCNTANYEQFCQINGVTLHRV